MRFANLFKAIFGAFDASKMIVLTGPGVLLAAVIAFWVLPPPVFIDSSDLRIHRDSLDSERSRLIDEVSIRQQLASVSTARRARDTLALALRRKLLDAYDIEPGTSAATAATAADERAAFRTLLAQLDSIGAATLASDTLHPGKFAEPSDSLRLLALDSLIADADARLATRWRFDQSIDVLLESALLFILLGFTLGTLLNPLNKALISVWTFDQRLMRKRLEQAEQRMKQAEQLTKEELRIETDHKGPNWGGRRRSGLIPGAGPLDVKKLKSEGPSPGDKNIRWYIGKKVLSEAEYDHMVAHYYRYAELAAGLILPLFGIAVTVIVYGLSDGGSLGLTLLGFFLLAAPAGAWNVGTRRYDRFRLELEEFIDGRLEWTKEEAERAEQQLQEDCVGKLDDVEAQLKRLADAIEPPKGP